MRQPSKIAEKAAGKFIKVSEKDRLDIFNRTRNLLEAGRVEEARQLILKYLQRETHRRGVLSGRPRLYAARRCQQRLPQLRGHY